jgi:hypothetical protein
VLPARLVDAIPGPYGVRSSEHSRVGIVDSSGSKTQCQRSRRRVSTSILNPEIRRHYSASRTVMGSKCFGPVVGRLQAHTCVVSGKLDRGAYTPPDNHLGMSTACTDVLTYRTAEWTSKSCFREYVGVDGQLATWRPKGEVAWTVAWRRRILPSACGRGVSSILHP